jgi:hypothetical protein
MRQMQRDTGSSRQWIECVSEVSFISHVLWQHSAQQWELYQGRALRLIVAAGGCLCVCIVAAQSWCLVLCHVPICIGAPYMVVSAHRPVMLCSTHEISV